MPVHTRARRVENLHAAVQFFAGRPVEAWVRTPGDAGPLPPLRALRLYGFIGDAEVGVALAWAGRTDGRPATQVRLFRFVSSEVDQDGERWTFDGPEGDVMDVEPVYAVTEECAALVADARNDELVAAALSAARAQLEDAGYEFVAAKVT